MSIMRMRRRFAVHLRYILYGVIGVFVLTLPAMFGLGGGGGGRDQNEELPALQETIAEVDGKPVPRRALEDAFRQTANQLSAVAQITGQAMGVERLWRERLRAFDEAVTRQLVLNEAERQGISISKRQVAKHADELAKQQLEQIKVQVTDKDQLERQLAYIASSNDGRPRETMSERSFVKWLSKWLLDKQFEALRADLVTEELKKKVTGSITASEKELLASYDETSVEEIVVSLHPPDQPERTDEEARARAEDLLARLKQGEDFEKLARAESDDPDAKYTGGRKEPRPLSSFPEAYQQVLEKLKPGEMAPEPIKTDFGYVILKLRSRRQNRPQDYRKNKSQYLQGFAEQKRRAAWDEYTKQLREKAEVKVLDKEILAYQEVKKGNLKEALPLLEEARPVADQIGGLAAAAIYYELAILYSVQNEWQKAADAYAAANDVLSGEGGLPQARAQALLGMARAYENLGDLEKAVKWYQVAGEASTSPSLHEQLRLTYQRLGKDDLVQQEQQWLDEYRKQEEARNKALQEQQRKMEEEAAKKRPRPAPAPGSEQK